MPPKIEYISEEPGERLCASTWRRPGCSPVLALHGWLDNSASFHPLGELLSDIDLVALDTPGHGKSDTIPEKMVFHFVEAAYTIDRAVKALGWEKFSIVGHSLGAAMGALYAGAFPERIEKLVLIDTLGPMTDLPEKAPGRLRRHVEERRLPPAKVRSFSSFEHAVVVRASIGPMSNDAAERLVKYGSKKTIDGWTWRSDPRLRMTSANYLTEAEVHAFLKRIECPALYIEALEGLTGASMKTPERIQCFRNIRVKKVSGGHHVHLEDPKSVAPLVQEFLG